MTDKEDAFRKKIRSNLDPKGWEALLEGVPRADDEASSPETEAEPAAGEPSGKHVLRVTDAGGRTAERVVSEPEAGPSVPPAAEDPPGPSRPAGEPVPAGDESAPGAGADRPGPEPRRGRRRGRLARWTAALEALPAVQAARRFYRGLQPREQRIVAAGLLLLAALLAYALLLDPLWRRGALLDRQIQQKQAELAEMIRLRSSVVRDQGGMERIQKILAQRGPSFSLFAYLETLATKAEMKDRIVHIKPRREQPVGPFRETQAEVRLAGAGLDELVRFLYQIESSEDLLYVKSLRIKASAKKDKAGLDVDLSVATLLPGRG